MGVQIAAALGAEVHVISQTRSKEADGRRFGAAGYHATSEDGTLRNLRGTFDLVVSTVSAEPQVNLPFSKGRLLLQNEGKAGRLLEQGFDGRSGGRVHHKFDRTVGGFANEWHQRFKHNRCQCLFREVRQ